MRIERLELRAFGSFTGTSLDLSDRVLHILYGPNEAGKTTARAAITSLLYGFDFRSNYAFLHPMNRLQLGARLSDDYGTAYDVIRYKRNNNPLVEARSGEPIGADLWSELLHSVTKSDFDAMFTFGWEELVRQTASLVADNGDAGATLFAAGLGVQQLGDTLKKLDDEAGALFSARATTREVNAALKASNEARRRARELSIRPSRYEEERTAYERASALHEAVVARRHTADQDYERLVTLRGVLPALTERRMKLKRRNETLAEAPQQSERWAAAVQLALVEREEHTRVRSSAEEQLRSFDVDLARLEVDDILLGVADQIDTLNEEIASYVQGRSDRGGLEEGLREAEAAAFALVRTLIAGPPDVHSLDVARAVLAGKAAFTKARVEWMERSLKQQQASDLAKQLRDTKRRLEEELAVATAPIDTSPLRESLRAAERRGDLDHGLAHARSDVEVATMALREVAGGLGLLEDEILLHAAISQPSPSREEIQAILSTLSALQDQERDARIVATRERERAEGLRWELEVLAREGHLPSEDDLTEHRDRRDATWTLIKSAWLDGEVLPAGEDGEAEEIALADAYEQLSRQADTIADHLWREASRTARRSRLSTDLEQAELAAAKAMESARGLATESATVYANWRAGWPHLAITAHVESLPRWATDVERLREQHRAVELARRNHRTAFKTLREHRYRVSALLEELGVTSVAGDELGPLLERSREFLAEAEAKTAARRELERELHELGRKIPSASATLDRETSAEREAAAAFQALMGPYKDRTASLAEGGLVVEVLEELEMPLQTMLDRQRRIDGIDRRSDAFESTLRSLLAFAPAIDQSSPVEAARELVRRLARARDGDAQRRALKEKREKGQQLFDAAEVELAGLRSQLRLFAEEVGISDIEELEARADRTLELVQLNSDLAALEDQILAQGGGRSIDELESDAEGQDLTELNVAVEMARETCAELASHVQELAKTAQDLSYELSKMDGSDAAAREAQLAQESLDRARVGADRYIRLLLARFIMDEAIRRYREAHQHPLLERASSIFGELTSGHWRAVIVTENSGEPRVGATSEGGSEHQIADLSEGTRDQLYLSLRMAAIEAALHRCGSMPVILDDVLVNFDNDRATSALRCFAALTSLGQILLFTHHRHVVELAEQALGSTQVRIHDLSCFADDPAT